MIPNYSPEYSVRGESGLPAGFPPVGMVGRGVS